MAISADDVPIIGATDCTCQCKKLHVSCFPMTDLQSFAAGLREWLRATDESYESIGKRAHVGKRTIMYFLAGNQASWATLTKLDDARKQNGKAA